MKKPKTVETYRLKRENYFKEINSKHGKPIQVMLDNGLSIGPISKKLNLNSSTVAKFLKWANLYEQCKLNNKNAIIKIAQTNGKLSANTLKGVELKKLTPEICNWFKGQKRLGRYRQQVCTDLFEKFGYGEKKYIQLCNKYGFPKNNPQTGELNPMFGKSPGKNAGIGSKGWILIDGKLIFFRSSLEFKIYHYLEDNNIQFALSSHRISYLDGETKKTYCPDYVVDKTIYEIKPEKLLQNESVKKKILALQEYCLEMHLKCGVITENTFSLTKFKKEDIDEMMSTGKLKMLDEKNYEKLLRNL